MLKLINTLKPFFEDNYKRINVREYARIMKISPPTASKILEEYYKEGLLKKEEDKRYIYYFTNKESNVFIDLLRIYWRTKLESVGLIDFFEKSFLNPLVILYGSFSKSEINLNSDIDIVLITPTKKNIELDQFEKKLKRRIHLFIFKNRESINTELLNSLLEGYMIRGHW